MGGSTYTSWKKRSPGFERSHEAMQAKSLDKAVTYSVCALSKMSGAVMFVRPVGSKLLC